MKEASTIQYHGGTILPSITQRNLDSVSRTENQMRTSRKEVIATLVTKARKFRFCGASADPDEITAVTSGYIHLIIGFKRLVGPLLPEPAASQLNAIDVEIDNIYWSRQRRRPRSGRKGGAPIH
jgi:hypothetical protein